MNRIKKLMVIKTEFKSADIIFLKKINSLPLVLEKYALRKNIDE